MFDSVFDLPLAIAGPAIILSLCAFAMIGLTATFFFRVEDVRLHAIMVTLHQLVYDKVMQGRP